MIRVNYWIPESAYRSSSYLRRCRIIVTASLVMLPAALTFGIFYAAIGIWMGLYINLVAMSIILACMLVMKKWGNADVCGNIFAFSAFAFFMVYCLTVYGLNYTCSAWLLMVPIAGFIMVGPKAGLWWALLTLLGVVTLIFLDAKGELVHPQFDPTFVPLIHFMTSGGFIILGAVILYSNETHKETIFGELEAKKFEVESQKKLLEEKNAKIQDYNRKLELEVAARTKGLQLSNEELDTFLYESSHALRRPVVRIIGLGNVIGLAESKEEAATYLEHIDASARKMDQMLHDLLSVSKVNHHHLTPSEIPLATFMAKLVDDFDSTNPFQLRTEIQIPESILVTTDKVLFKLLLNKLFLNAAQFTKTDQELGWLNILGRIEEGMVVLELKDSGSGIHPAALPEVFRMFSKGSLDGSGSGLGLYIAQKAATRLGIQLEAESEFGNFTRIRLVFPYSQ